MVRAIEKRRGSGDARHRATPKRMSGVGVFGVPHPKLQLGFGTAFLDAPAFAGRDHAGVGFDFFRGWTQCGCDERAHARIRGRGGFLHGNENAPAGRWPPPHARELGVIQGSGRMPSRSAPQNGDCGSSWKHRAPLHLARRAGEGINQPTFRAAWLRPGARGSSGGSCWRRSGFARCCLCPSRRLRGGLRPPCAP